VAHLSALLDDEDKQNLLNTAKPAYERVDILMTEVLPRRGPTAFHSFVQGLEKVDPSIAQSLRQDAGIKGIMITSFTITLVCSTCDPLGKGRGGSLLYKKGRGLSEILKRTPMRYQDPVFWAWLELFSPLSSTNSKTTH